MPMVHIPDWDKYVRAFDVLFKVGGTFQGRPEQVLLVTEAQYQALVDAQVVTPNGTEAATHGPKSKKKPHV